MIKLHKKALQLRIMIFNTLILSITPFSTMTLNTMTSAIMTPNIMTKFNNNIMTLGQILMFG